MITINASEIILHHGASNIIDFELMEELSHALDQLAETPLIRISSSLPHFSLGVDIGIHTPELTPRMLSQFHALIRKLYHFNGFTYCKIQGYTLGGGLELALACDWIVADAESRLGFPEIKLACFPPVAAVLLPRRIGSGSARRLLYTGQMISAEEAYRIGLIDSTGEFPFEGYSRDALKALKKAMRFDFDAELQKAETIYLESLLKSPELRNAVDAFLKEKEQKNRIENDER